MKNPLLKYSIYLLSVITVVCFFIMGFMPYEMEIPVVVLFSITIVLYAIYSIIMKQVDKTELICDTIMFITFNIIGFGMIAFYFTLLPYTFYCVTGNFLLSIIYFATYVTSIWKSLKKKKAIETNANV